MTQKFCFIFAVFLILGNSWIKGRIEIFDMTDYNQVHIKYLATGYVGEISGEMQANERANASFD